MSTRVLLSGPPRKGILQPNFNLENEKENQAHSQHHQRKGVILVTPQHDSFDDEDDWQPSPKRSSVVPKYVTNSDSASQRRRHKPAATTISVPGAPAHVIARRNERERNRVRQVNDSFSMLRGRIPEYLYDTETDERGKQTRRKLSKVETLRLAVDYIQQLECLLNIKPETRQDDSEEDGFFSSAETTTGSFFKGESDLDLDPEQSQDAVSLSTSSNPEVSSPSLFETKTVFKLEPGSFQMGQLTKGSSEVDERFSDSEGSTVGSPLPPINESFPSRLSYSDLYAPYGLVDLSTKGD